MQSSLLLSRLSWLLKGSVERHFTLAVLPNLVQNVSHHQRILCRGALSVQRQLLGTAKSESSLCHWLSRRSAQHLPQLLHWTTRYIAHIILTRQSTPRCSHVELLSACTTRSWTCCCPQALHTSKCHCLLTGSLHLRIHRLGGRLSLHTAPKRPAKHGRL